MAISLSVASAVIISFVAWLFFSHTKKEKRPEYTRGKEKRNLYDIDGMLSNVTGSKEPEIKELETEPNQPAEIPEEIEDTSSDKRRNQEYGNHPPDTHFDLKQAIIGAAVLDKKKKKH